MIRNIILTVSFLKICGHKPFCSWLVNQDLTFQNSAIFLWVNIICSTFLLQCPVLKQSRTQQKYSIDYPNPISNPNQPPHFWVVFPILPSKFVFRWKNSYNNLMKATSLLPRYFHIIITLWVVLIPSGGCYCPSSFTFSHSTCTFEYGYNDANCSIFTFSKCSWSACMTWEGEPHNSYCQHRQNVSSSDWTLCTSNCCTSGKNYPQQLTSIQECQADINQSTTITMIIFVASIVSASLLFLSFVLFCCCKQRIYNKCGCIKGCCEAVSDFFFGMVTCRCYAREIQLDKFTQKVNYDLCPIQSSWSIPQSINQKLNDVCSVCLQGKPTLELQCHHVFHRQCIIACITKKQECIMCRSKEFNKIKIYCETCLKAYFETTLIKHVNVLANCRQVCSACKQVEQQGVKIDIK